MCGPNSPTLGLNLFTNPLYGPGGYDAETAKLPNLLRKD